MIRSNNNVRVWKLVGKSSNSSSTRSHRATAIHINITIALVHLHRIIISSSQIASYVPLYTSFPFIFHQHDDDTTHAELRRVYSHTNYHKTIYRSHSFTQDFVTLPGNQSAATSYTMCTLTIITFWFIRIPLKGIHFTTERSNSLASSWNFQFLVVNL